MIDLLILEKYGLFSDFQYRFRSFGWTADPQTVVSDRTGGVFKRFGTTWAIALDIFTWQGLAC